MHDTVTQIQPAKIKSRASINLRVPASIRLALDQAAAERLCSSSVIVRGLLVDWLAERRRTRQQNGRARA